MKNFLIIMSVFLINLQTSVAMNNETTIIEPITLTNTEQRLINSSKGNYQLLSSNAIQQIQPNQPIILTLDGNALFATGYRELLLNQAQNQNLADKPILWGLGYPDTTLFNARRLNDYTPTGSAHLHELIGRQLPKPMDKKITLVGHSLGGLFALQALSLCVKNNDCPYEQIYIASPSLWWQDEQIVKELDNWLSLAKKNPKNLPKITLTIGGLEQTPNPHDDEKRQNLLKQRKMLDHAKWLSQKLTAYHIQHDFIIFDNLRHHETADATLKLAIQRYFDKP